MKKLEFCIPVPKLANLLSVILRWKLVSCPDKNWYLIVQLSDVFVVDAVSAFVVFVVNHLCLIILIAIIVTKMM